MTSPTLSLERLSLRRGERMLIAGGTGSGKSTLTSPLLQDFLDRYANSRALILDTKPRFRAQWELTGISAKFRYRHWDHGTVVPDSVYVEQPSDLAAAWRLGHRVAIVQSPGGTDLARHCAVARKFFDQARTSRPQLLVVDEMLDFYGPTGAPRAGTDNIIVMTCRAGRERGMGALNSAQRLKGFPGQILETMTRCALFRLDYIEDVKRLPECGAPRHFVPPTEDWLFNYWTKHDRPRVYGPYQLAAAAVR